MGPASEPLKALFQCPQILSLGMSLDAVHGECRSQGICLFRREWLVGRAHHNAYKTQRWRG